MVSTEKSTEPASTPAVYESHETESWSSQNKRGTPKFRPQDVNSLFLAAAEKQSNTPDSQRIDSQQKRGQPKSSARVSPKPAPASISSATGHFKLASLRKDSISTDPAVDSSQDVGSRARDLNHAATTTTTSTTATTTTAAAATSVLPDPLQTKAATPQTMDSTPAPAAEPAEQATQEEKKHGKDVAAPATNVPFVPSGFSWDTWDDDDEFDATAKSKSVPRGISTKDRFSNTLKDKMKLNSQVATDKPAPATTGAKPNSGTSKPLGDDGIAPWANKRVPAPSAKSISDQIKQAREGRTGDRAYGPAPPVRTHGSVRGGPSPFGLQNSGISAAGSSTESGGDSLSRFRIKGDLPLDAANDRFQGHGFGGDMYSTDRFGRGRYGHDDSRYGGSFNRYEPPAPISWKQRSSTVPIESPPSAPIPHASENSAFVPVPKPNSDSVPRQIPSRFMLKPEGFKEQAPAPVSTSTPTASPMPAQETAPAGPAEKSEPEKASIDPEELKRQQHEAMKLASQKAFALRAERERKDEEERQKRIQERLKAFEKSTAPQPEPANVNKPALRKPHHERKADSQPLLQGTWLERRQAALAGKPLAEPAQPILSKSFARKQRFESPVEGSAHHNPADKPKASQENTQDVVQSPGQAAEPQPESAQQGLTLSADKKPAPVPLSPVWSQKSGSNDGQRVTDQERSEARAQARAQSKNPPTEDQKLVKSLEKLNSPKQSRRAIPVTTTPYVSLAKDLTNDAPVKVSLPLNDENAPMVRRRLGDRQSQDCFIWPPTVSSNWFGTTSVVYRGLKTYLREPPHHVNDLTCTDKGKFGQFRPMIRIPGVKTSTYRRTGSRPFRSSNREPMFSARKASLRD